PADAGWRSSAALQAGVVGIVFPWQHLIRAGVLRFKLENSRQKKAAHTASTCSYPRALNVPTFHTAASLFARVANASNNRITRFRHSYNGRRQRMVCAAQVANCV